MYAINYSKPAKSYLDDNRFNYYVAGIYVELKLLAESLDGLPDDRDSCYYRSENATDSYRIDLDSPTVGQAHGLFRLPFAAHTQEAIQQALAPGFVLDQADAATQQVLVQILGSPEAAQAYVDEFMTAAKSQSAQAEKPERPRRRSGTNFITRFFNRLFNA